jgi:hypothetical protein
VPTNAIAAIADGAKKLEPAHCCATWLKIVDPKNPHETLCSDCMFQRAFERRINLTFDDLELSPFNLFGSPSWFDYFGGNEIVGAHPAGVDRT